MKTVNSVSAGKRSSYMAYHYPADYNVYSVVCVDDPKCGHPDKYVMDYANRKLEKYAAEFGEFIGTAEDPQTLRVMIDLEQAIGREIIWVRGMSFDDVIDKGTPTILPSSFRRYCTEIMKLLPIFLWWWHNIHEKVNMRIGFTFDEFDRIERFWNNKETGSYSIATSCRTYGMRKKVHEIFDWRFCTFPMAKAGINKTDVDAFWNNHKLPGDLFTEPRKIEFPVISNCAGCFHKSEETIAAMSLLTPAQINWFARQELKGMGTWLNNKLTYQHLIDNAPELSKEVLFEITRLKQSCDSGGCTA